MTRQELRVFLGEWFCGCGHAESAASRLRDLLALHPLYEHREAVSTLLPDEGIRHLLLYTLDHFDLTEHGSSILGSWLTDKGRDVLNALDKEVADNFNELTCSACIHGYGLHELDHCAECSKL